MRKFALIASLPLLLLMSRPSLASDVVVSIPPLHALVQGVMGDTGKAELLLTGNKTPHNFQLRPSQLRMMEQSKVVFYISPMMESSMMKAFNILPERVQQMQMETLPGLQLRPFRGGENWAPHSHDHGSPAKHEEHEEHEGHKDHDHDHKHEEHAKHDDHDDDDDDDHDHDHGNDHKHEHDEHKHDDHDHAAHDKHGAHEDHHHGDGHDHDPHIWLSTENAKVMVHEIAHKLAKLFPANAARYAANAEQLEAEITRLKSDLIAELAPVQDVPFLVLHDAYQYLEIEIQLTAVGSILVNPSVPPSVKRLTEIQNRVRNTGTVCIFREPQFPDRIARTVAEGSDIKLGTLDPLGGSLSTNGSLADNGYLKMMRTLARDLKECLS